MLRRAQSSFMKEQNLRASCSNIFPRFQKGAKTDLLKGKREQQEDKRRG